MSGQAGSMPKNPLLATGGPRIMHLVISINMACSRQQSALNYVKVIDMTNNHSYLICVKSVLSCFVLLRMLGVSTSFFSAKSEPRFVKADLSQKLETKFCETWIFILKNNKNCEYLTVSNLIR
jgi:hypothetical protein